MLKQIKPSNPILYRLLVVFFVLSLISVVGLTMDSRLVLGINPWLKVLKFDLSIFIFAATMIWVLRDLSIDFTNQISKQMAICLYVEIIAITVQAIRGTRSHFNNETLLDGIIFTVMGIFIIYNTYLLGRITYVYFKAPPKYSFATILSIRLGMITLLLGSFLGGYMSSRTGHSIGVADGGTGLPFVNWSTIAGDLRVAHFLGLHGIQIFLLMGVLLTYFKISERRSVIVLILSFTWFIGFIIFTLSQALSGQPFLS